MLKHEKHIEQCEKINQQIEKDIHSILNTILTKQENWLEFSGYSYLLESKHEVNNIIGITSEHKMLQKDSTVYDIENLSMLEQIEVLKLLETNRFTIK